MKLSVIICTHNPRSDYLARALDALRNQTLPSDQWELLLIDNASIELLSETWDLSWHPNALHIREERLGLTPARLRGISASRAGVILFVDDDNVLSPNYLKFALELVRQYPNLGAFGGSTMAEYSKPPPVWMERYESLIGVREIKQIKWTNYPADFDSDPIGAGLVVRRIVAEAYVQKILTSPSRQTFDRVGQHLTGSGDVDLVYTACDIQMGKGVFPDLKLTHLIPEERCAQSYLLKLTFGSAYSTIKLRIMRGMAIPNQGFLRKLSLYKRLLMSSHFDRKMLLANYSGIQKALQERDDVAAATTF